MRTPLAVVITLLTLSCGLMAQEQKRGPSTPDERARAVRIARALEERPADKSLHDDYAWLLRWAAEVPDITVAICSANMPWNDKYEYGGDLGAVGFAATVSFVIQHPEEGKDEATAGTAAMEAMLRAYQKILEKDTKAHSREMDDVVEVQKQGKLADYIRQRWADICKK